MNIFITLMALFFLFTANVASFWFIFNYMKTDVISSLFAGYQAAALCEALYTLITAYILRDEIQEIFDIFEDFYELSEKYPNFLCKIKSKVKN